MPQLDIQMFSTQIFWLAITFCPLLLIIWRIAVPRISNSLEARQKRNEDNLEKASSFRKEAEIADQTYEESLLKAKMAAMMTISETQKKLEEEIALRELETSLRLNELIIESEDRIQSAVNLALEDIHKVGEDVTGIVTKTLLGKSIDSATIKTAVNEIMVDAPSIGNLTITREQV
jgi:F-type H+-transporting ATPase subunit b